LVGVNKDSFLVLEKLPAEYDSRVKAMEVDERPTEEFTDIGGLEKQIEELREAIVLPIVHKDKFKNLGIRPPKGVLMHGPPGVGKTMMARACAAQTSATFLKLAGPQLVQVRRLFFDQGKVIRNRCLSVMVPKSLEMPLLLLKKKLPLLSSLMNWMLLVQRGINLI